MRTELCMGLILVGVGALLAIVLAGGSGHALPKQLAGGASALAVCVGAAGLLLRERALILRVEQLRGWVNLVAGQSDMARHEVAADADAVDRVQLAILDMIGMRLDQQSAIYRRLEEVLNALPDGVAVITPEGLVSLVNAPGRPLFRHAGKAIGTSVFEVLSRHALGDAIAQARSAGKPVDADLYTVWSEHLRATVTLIGNEGSILLRFPASEAVSGGGEHDLSLHDRPPAAAPATAETPLAHVSAIAIDTETTGLDTRNDRVISIGGVRLQGERLYRSATLNFLVNPGRPIPNRTIAVHGISNSMVADAPLFPGIAAEFAAATENLVMVGHHVAFDVRMLENEMRAARRDWLPAHSLDVMLLYAGLFPDRTTLSLDDMAAALNVPVIGRHSALGDALTTAEIYVRLVPLLIERGFATLGAAEGLQAEAEARLRRAMPRRTAGA
ncbi:MAG TPA: exonuclease domain-containing protein [Dongiaceae bacterium]|nr:exonuclease domain-containing protein [Dongiaceae bacterium]